MFGLAARLSRRSRSALVKLQHAVRPVVEGLESRRLMTVNEEGFLISFADEFEGSNDQHNASWNGGGIVEYHDPDPGNPPEPGHFMRFDGGGSLTLSNIYKHVGVEVSLTLYLLGDTDPQPGSCNAFGNGGGPDWEMTVGEKTKQILWDVDTPFQSNALHLNHSILGEPVEDDGNSSCVSESEVQQDRSYSVSVTDHKHSGSELTISFGELNGEDTTRWGIDGITVRLVKATLPGRRNNDPNENKGNQNPQEDPGPNKPPGRRRRHGRGDVRRNDARPPIRGVQRHCFAWNWTQNNRRLLHTRGASS